MASPEYAVQTTIQIIQHPNAIVLTRIEKQISQTVIVQE